MDMIASCRVLKGHGKKEVTELHTKFNEKSLVSITKGDDMIQFITYFGCCLEKGLE